MTCSQARHLLNQGIIPGSARGRSPELGFHLANCPDCRAYRERLNQELLAQLIVPQAITTTQRHIPPAKVVLQPAAQPRSILPQPSTTSRGQRTQRSGKPRRRQSSLAIVTLGSSALLLLFIGWYLGLPLYRAFNRDIKQWSVAAAPVSNTVPVLATAAATSTSRLTTPLPTTMARPSQTPLPTATATPTPTITPTPTPTLPLAQSMTILLLGIDARPGEGMVARSDAMMLVRIDRERGDVALLSMPRDLWVDIPGYGESKLNAAFYLGELAQPDGGGMALAKQTLTTAFNLRIDYAVVIDFTGFRSLIDALGGITVDVPKTLYDGHFPTDDYGYTVAHFLPGLQQMDGATALTYARIRHPDSDFERIKRQQLVLLGISQKIKERGAVQNLHEADQLTAALTPYIQTDMSPDLVLSMLWSMREIDPAKVQRYTIDSSMVWETSVNGAYALVPQQGVLPALGQKLLTDLTP